MIAGQTKTQVPATDTPALEFVPGKSAMGVVLVTGLTNFPGGTGAEDRDAHVFNSYQFSNDMTWVEGRHSLKLGGSLERTQFNTHSENRTNGDYRFRSIAQFLTNDPDRFRAQLPGSDTVRGHRQWIGSLYVQDTWKVANRVTVDLGLRWEFATVPSEVNGKVANLDQITDTEMRLGDPFSTTPPWRTSSPGWESPGTCLEATGRSFAPDTGSSPTCFCLSFSSFPGYAIRPSLSGDRPAM